LCRLARPRRGDGDLRPPLSGASAAQPATRLGTLRPYSAPLGWWNERLARDAAESDRRGDRHIGRRGRCAQERGLHRRGGMAGLAAAIVSTCMLTGRRLHGAFVSTRRHPCVGDRNALGSRATDVHCSVQSALHAHAGGAESQSREKRLERRTAETPHRHEGGERSKQMVGSGQAAHGSPGKVARDRGLRTLADCGAYRSSPRRPRPRRPLRSPPPGDASRPSG
jgi:hypothetical protein